MISLGVDKMTREEVIKYGKEQLEVFGGKHAEFIKSAIELLKQKPISRNKEMRLIDANKLYEYIDDVKYTCDTYAKVEDILEIIDRQPTVNPIKISSNLTNKGLIKKAFPNIDLDLNQKHNGYFLGYRDKTELRPIIWFDENWLKEKYRKADK